MTDSSAQHARLQKGLAANGIHTSGTMQQCLDRLLQTNPRKRKSVQVPATTAAVRAAIVSNVEDKLDMLPDRVLSDLVACFGVRSSPKRRARKIAEHLVK